MACDRSIAGSELAAGCASRGRGVGLTGTLTRFCACAAGLRAVFTAAAAGAVTSRTVSSRRVAFGLTWA